MKIELKEILIKDLIQGYENNQEEGVSGFNGKLDIRPKYQREFVYKPEQEKAVIDTVMKDFPLNVMYWVKKNDEDSYEVLDGQQRAISICNFVDGRFSINVKENPFYFENLTSEERNQILDYKLMVYFCEGTDREKLDWFKTINIAGEKLTNQELRNAVYTGRWLSDAKRHFSKTGCPAYSIGSKYVKGSPIRQDYLETAIKWISEDNIEEYMSKNQTKPNSNELWTYFQNVINWIQLTFPNYRKELMGIDWGALYNAHKDNEYDSDELEKEIRKLMIDEDVTKKSGIYSYILTGAEKYLSIRAFSDKQKRESFERQNGICPSCKGEFKINEMEADHTTPWSEGGRTTSDNCKMLCKNCNRTKSNK
jgi:hypothetical protein